MRYDPVYVVLAAGLFAALAVMFGAVVIAMVT